MVNGSKVKVNCTVTLREVHKEQMFRCRNYACSFSSRTKKGLTNHVDKCAIARLEVIKEMERQRDFSSQT